MSILDRISAALVAIHKAGTNMEHAFNEHVRSADEFFDYSTRFKEAKFINGSSLNLETHGISKDAFVEILAKFLGKTEAIIEEQRKLAVTLKEMIAFVKDEDPVDDVTFDPGKMN